MSFGLGAVSQAVARVAAGAAASVCAIRVGLNGHISGLVCEGGLIVTSAQALPAVASHAVVLPGATLAGARPWLRDAAGRLAVLHLETPCEVVNPPVVGACLGALAVVVGADADAAVTVRLTVVHRLLRNGDVVLDLSKDRVDPGSLVLDAEGRLVGLLALGPNGEAVVIPSSEVGMVLRGSLVDGGAAGAVAAPGVVAGAFAAGGLGAGVVVPHSQRRAWLGVALQPIMVPEAVAARAGQDSGRMVVSMTKGGPAELAGLRVGDVLLALNGTSASGPQALRAFLSPDRIGSSIEVRLLRDGNLLTAYLTVAVQPD